MVVMRFGAWSDVSEELKKMMAGNIIDAFVITYRSSLTGATIEQRYYNTSQSEIEVVLEMLPYILPECGGYEILGRETINIEDRTLRIAQVNCLPTNPS